MDPFQMVVVIVLIGCGTGVVNNWLKARSAHQIDGETERELEKVRIEVDRLRERVRVLEKIATDGDSRLREEISRLA